MTPPRTRRHPVRRATIWILMLTTIAAGLLLGDRAQARPIDGFGPLGLKLQTPSGSAEMGQHHLGELVVWCIDLNSRGPRIASDWHSAPAERVGKQHGGELSESELAEIAWLVDRARTVARDDVGAAAVDHLIRRRTIGDEKQRARMEERYHAARLARPQIADRVAELERGLRGVGADRLQLEVTAPGVSSPGAITAHLSGPRGDAPAGIPLVLTVGGVRRQLSTDATGRARLELPARDPGQLTVQAFAELPALRPILHTAKDFQDPRSPDRLVQRMVSPGAPRRLTAQAHGTVQPLRPRIVTRTSQPVAQPGVALSDQVRVQGAGGVRAEVRALLWGPYPRRPTPQDCRPGDPRAGEVRFRIDGDGDYQAPPIRIEKPGFYVWQEILPATGRSAEVVTGCGIAEETTLVKARPTITTVTSAAEVTGAARITDLVRVSGLPAGGGVRQVTATLFGPYPQQPTAQDCRPGDPRAGTVRLEVRHDGDYRTPAVPVHQPGFYVWQETLAADERTAAVTTPCGEATETTLVRATPPPPMPAPAASPARPAPATASPVRLRIPSGIPGGH